MPYKGYEIVVSIRGVENREELERLWKDIAYKILNELEQKMVRNILRVLEWKGHKRFNLVYMGNLLKSIQVDYEESELVVSVPYSVVLEYGSNRPFKPPVDPLIRWAYLRLKIRKEDAVKMGWALVKKFSKEGFKPHPYLRPSLEEVLGQEIP